jgi:uncharacterized membrane protein affecting hemolysin expression
MKGAINTFEARFLLLVIANVVFSALILSTLMMGTTYFSQTSALARATRRQIQIDRILQANLNLDTFLASTTEEVKPISPCYLKEVHLAKG